MIWLDTRSDAVSDDTIYSAQLSPSVFTNDGDTLKLDYSLILGDGVDNVSISNFLANIQFAGFVIPANGGGEVRIEANFVRRGSGNTFDISYSAKMFYDNGNGVEKFFVVGDALPSSSLDLNELQTIALKIVENDSNIEIDRRYGNGIYFQGRQ